MRKVIYSERRRRIHAFFKNLYKKSMFYQWSKKSHGIDASNVDPLTGLYNPFGINTFLKEAISLYEDRINYKESIISRSGNKLHIEMHYTLKQSNEEKSLSITYDNLTNSLS